MTLLSILLPVLKASLIASVAVLLLAAVRGWRITRLIRAGVLTEAMLWEQ
jgi:hypothetical protein